MYKKLFPLGGSCISANIIAKSLAALSWDLWDSSHEAALAKQVYLVVVIYEQGKIFKRYFSW